MSSRQILAATAVFLLVYWTACIAASSGGGDGDGGSERHTRELDIDWLNSYFHRNAVLALLKAR